MSSLARPHIDQSGGSNDDRIQGKAGSALRGKQTLFIAVAWCINVLAYSIVYPFLPIYLHAIRGIPMSTVGLIFPVMGLAAIIGSPISGWLADHAGRRALLIGGPIGRSGAFFLLAWMAAIQAPFAWFVVGLFFASLLGKFFQNAANAYITDMLPPNERLSAFNKVHVGANIGWMVGPAVGAFLARMPYSLMFTITAICCLGTAAITWFFCPTTSPLGVKKRAPLQPPSQALLRALRDDRRMVALVGLTLCLLLSVSQFATTLSVYATEMVGISKTDLGFLYTINGALVILLLLPVNEALKQWNIFRRIGMGALLYTIAFIGFGLSSTWLQLAICMAVMTVGEMLSLTAILAAVSQIAPPNMIGRYMGVHGLVDGLGWAIGPYIGALLFEQVHGQGLLLWALLSVFSSVAGVGFFTIVRFWQTTPPDRKAME